MATESYGVRDFLRFDFRVRHKSYFFWRTRYALSGGAVGGRFFPV